MTPSCSVEGSPILLQACPYPLHEDQLNRSPANALACAISASQGSQTSVISGITPTLTIATGPPHGQSPTGRVAISASGGFDLNASGILASSCSMTAAGVAIATTSGLGGDSHLAQRDQISENVENGRKLARRQDLGDLAFAEAGLDRSGKKVLYIFLSFQSSVPLCGLISF
ncbi:unnamed protein product [Protopolystoma xenopodis]|uniref:Uncharacterized protein n=1 Tax=Protopolystoma xenopodis TaxID=117903 RepID=A0A3S5A499_9PLAT|nr:unnamed protein product [Protopolystoma xenopodis]